MIRGVRGAITCDKNTKEEILSRTQELLKEMFLRNQIEPERISAIIFTATKDLNAAYPAEGARLMGLKNVPLLDMQQMEVVNALPMTIRVLILFESTKAQEEIRHVYLRGAKNLRSDLHD